MSSKKAPKNKYVKNSHLSERKFRELLGLFCADATALSAASLTGLNRNTVNRHHGMLRARIAEACEADSPFGGEVEADESCFGARRAIDGATRLPRTPTARYSSSARRSSTASNRLKERSAARLRPPRAPSRRRRTASAAP